MIVISISLNENHCRSLLSDFIILVDFGHPTGFGCPTVVSNPTVLIHSRGSIDGLTSLLYTGGFKHD